MTRTLTLGKKIAIGFGIVVVITLILGVVTRTGLSRVSKTYAIMHQGNKTMSGINTTGNYRRDFAITGFEKRDGETENAAEKWQNAYNGFVEELKTLQSANGLKNEYKSGIKNVFGLSEKYEHAFTQQKKAQEMQDQAFKEWGKVGWEVTGVVKNVLKTVIDPEIEKAQKSGQISNIIRWSTISTALDRDVIEPFLLLRVTAVYLLATNKEKQWQGYQKQLGVVRDGFLQWHALVEDNAKLSATAEKLENLIDKYEKAGKQYYAGIQEKNSTDKEMAVHAKAIVAGMNEIDTGIMADMKAIISGTNGLILILTIIGIIVAIVLAFVITVSIVKSVTKVIYSLSSGSEQIASASQQLAGSSQQLSEGASEQASNLEEVSSSLEEMSSMTKQNAENAKQANTLAIDANSAAGQSKEAMEKMASVINAIKSSSDETAKIIKTIDEIAMQTNLLALNAAVEAARAGEAGRGFAVVAEEVRNLAQRSAEAAKNTAELIEGAQSNSENGVVSSEEVGKSLDQIAETVGKVNQLIAEVSAASNEQSQGIDQVNTAVAQMDKVTQNNAASAEESASASEELSGQAQNMNAMVVEMERIVGSSSNVNGGNDHSGNSALSHQKKRKSKTRSYDFLQSGLKKGNGNGGNGADRRVTQEHRALANAAVNEVSPEQVIPLDDDDLKEF